jgi:uncharacterized protein (PEP-CTERM system associated)
MIRLKKVLLKRTIYPSLMFFAMYAAQRSAVAAIGSLSSASNEAGTLSSISNAQGAPPFGSSVQLGNFGSSIGEMLDSNLGGTLAAQGLTVTPSIGVQEEFTTANLGYYPNSNLGYSSQRSSFITVLTPALLINDQTRTVNAVVNYSPYIQLYDGRAYEDTLQQSLNAFVDVAVVPGSVNLGLRGYVTEQATAGGLNPGGSELLGPNNRTMTQSYSVEPSYHHFFPSAGTLDVAYLLGITRQSGNSAFLSNTSSPYFRNANLVSQTESANFLTVPIFRRFEDEPKISATEDIGTGILNDAHQYFINNTIRYAIIRDLILTGSGGYEDIKYQGFPPVVIQDGTWSVGFDYTPNASASIVARYQHLYGYDSPYIRANFLLTARTSLAASFTDELTTPQQQIGANVAGSSLNSFGIPIGATSGLPVILSNQTLSVQSNLQRQQIFSISTTTTYARNSISFSVIREQVKSIAVSPGLIGFSQNGLSASINYTHQLTEASSLSAYINYSKFQSVAVSNQNPSTYAAAINYIRQFSPSLYGNAEYIITNQNVGGFGSTNLQNTVIVGIQKTF